MGKKVLITGGGGFIGRSVAKRFILDGFKVVLFDLDFRLDCDEKALAHAEKIKGSILDSNAFNNAVRGCDYVIHLAAMLGVRRTEIKRVECLNINILGVINVLEACVKEKVQKIIFSSSSEVYGDTDGTPISEDSPKKPISIYAITKLAGEEYIKAYSERYGLKYSIVRFFNIYGPGQVAEFVMPRFIKNVLGGKPPVVYGDGSQVRTFCYVDDVAEAIARILESVNSDNQIFVIGNDKDQISMRDLAGKVIELSGKKLKPLFIPMSDSDRHSSREIQRRVPCINKARALLGYKPKVFLDEGIKRIMGCDNISETWFETL